MNGKFKKITSIALILAMLLTQLCCAVIGAQAASSSEGETVYFKLPADWAGRVDTTTGETVLPAAYTAGGTSGEYVPWVGTHMTKVEGTDDIYSFVIPGDQTFIIFNTGMQRDWQTGELALSGGDMLFVVDSDIKTKNAIGHWVPYNTDAPKVSIDTGTFNFVGKKDITLSRFNSTSGTYSINGGEEIPFENGQTVTIGEGIAQDTDVNLVLTASNGTDAVSYEYTFHKSPSLTIYAKNNAGWKDVYIHYWGGESTSVWPGVAMTPYQDSENVFYAEVPSKTTNFKFNNNMSGTSSEQQTVNLATQDLVAGAAECFIINKLNEGDTANTGEYTTLEKALSDAPEEGKPIISVDDVEGALGAEINVNISLQNIPEVSGYVIEVSYDSTAVEPVIGNIDSSIIANIKTPGQLYISYASETAKDFTEKTLLAAIPFKVIATGESQTKITATPKQMFADENTRITFPSSNIVSGKVTAGVDKSVLKEKLDYANSLNSSDYTATSFQALETAVNAAQIIYDLPSATQATVDAQVEALEAAISALVAESDDGNYFYFKNVVGWENVYVYWWGSETACPSFPGVKATLVEGTSDVYRVELPMDATGLNFNDGSNTDGDKAQTDSITGDNLVIGNIFVPNPDDYYEKNNGIRYRGVSEAYVPNKIYFKNVAGWDEVYAYWWGGTTACPAFPGVQPKLLAGTTDIYWIIFPEDATGFNFNNGKQGTDGGEQTSSMSKFGRGRILIMDLDSKYEKNGGYRYDAAYEDLAKHLPGAVVVGDVNEDGNISVADAIMVQKAIAQIVTLTDKQIAAADVTTDGEINIADAITIQKYIAGIITSFESAA